MQDSPTPQAPASRKRISKRSLMLIAIAGGASLFYACASPVALGSLGRLGGANPPIIGTPELVVMTYNVNYGVAGDESTIEAIAQSDAHIFLLQETTPEWEAAIADRVRGRFAHQYWRPPSRGYAASGAAILSTSPIRDIEASPSAVDWFEAIGATVDTHHGPVRVVSVHLEPAISIRALLQVSDHHEREIEAHIEALGLDQDRPTIVAGDFNEERAGALRELRSRGFVDAVDSFRPGVPTWAWSIGAMKVRLQLDHIVYSAHLEAMTCHIAAAGRSDHLPVRATFRFR